MKKNKIKVITIRLTEQEKAKVLKMAEEKETDVSKLVRQALKI